MSPSLLQSTLFLLIPLFSIALLVLALSHTPGPLKPQALLAYTYIASVTLLSTLAGVLPLSHSSNSLSEAVIQTLLFVFIGIPVLHLPPTYVPEVSIRKLHTSILLTTLSIATLSALINPFLRTHTPFLYISPSLFLLYTILAIPRIAYILHIFLYPEDSIQLSLPPPSIPHEIRKHHHKIPSVSTTSTITIVDTTRIHFPRQQHSDPLRSHILNSRSRSLLVFVLAVQIAALAANACALGITLSANNALKTVQTACTVLAITGSMSAYLLHTYNLHLRQTPTPDLTYNNLSAHSADQPQSPMLIQLAPPPRQRANAGVSIEKNLFGSNAKGATDADSDLEDLELELDVVMDIDRYSMTSGPNSGSRSGKKRTVVQDSIDLGLALVSSPACTPVPAPLPVPLPLRVSVEEGSRCGSWGDTSGGLSVLGDKEKQKERIQGYYLGSSSSVSTGSPSPFERYGTEIETETDLSSPNTYHPHLDAPGASPAACPNANTHTQVRKRSSFFGWEFAWDQEALERADDAGKMRSSAGGGSGGSPIRWRSGLDGNDNEKSDGYETVHPNASTHAHTCQKPVDDELMNLGGDRESFGPHPSLSRPSSEADIGRMKRAMSWRSSVCDAVGEKLKRKNTIGFGIGMKPLRLSRSFGGRTNRESRTETGRAMSHRTILSGGDVGPMCGLSLKRKATALFSGQGSPLRQGDVTIAAAEPLTPKRLKKKTKPGHSTAAAGIAGTSPSAESIHGSDRHLDSDSDELNEDADLQKTPTMTSRTTTRSYSPSPQPNRLSSFSSPQRHEVATNSESQCSSINESCITTTTTTVATITSTTTPTNSPPKLSPSLTRRGLSLKRSFKMGSTVGRTLGPGLTLSGGSGPALTSSASSSVGPCAHKPIRCCESEGFGFSEEDEKREKEKRESGKEVEKMRGEDEEGEDGMRSPVVARPGSASFACATPDETLAPTTRGGSEPASGSVKSKTVPKSMLHSRPWLPTMNISTTTASTSSCPTINQQCQQDGYGGHAWKPHPSVDGFRPLDASDIRGSDTDGVVVSLERGMDIIRNDDHDGLSSPFVSSSHPSLLPPPLRIPPLESQSLPPTPTKSRPMIPSEHSISSFKKRSAPPALPAPLESSEWSFFPRSISSTSGMATAGASMVSLGHTRSRSITQSIVGPTSQPSSRSTTPRPSIRLSAINMGTVRSAFAGVGAKVSARMSVNSASTRSSASAGNATSKMGMGMEMDDIDGDFMDLRDPFASPPPFKLANVFRGRDHSGNGDFWVSERAVSSLGGGVVAGYEEEQEAVEVGVMRSMTSVVGGGGGKRRANMNAWGRLPIPSTSHLEPGMSGRTGVASLVASRKKAHSHHGERRKHKEKRARNAAAAAAADLAGSCVNGCTGAPLIPSALALYGEDVDFGVEEALLSQRLLRRLDGIEWN